MSRQQLNEYTYFDRETGRFIFLPEILHFGADRYLLTGEEDATVYWEVKDATVIKLNDEIVAAAGRMTFSTTTEIVVVLNAINGADIPVERSLKIKADRKLPGINFFNADTDFAIKGMPVKLSWDVQGAAKLEIDNGVGNVTGKTSIYADTGVTGVFNLTAYNHFGDKTFASTSVLVFPVPLIKTVFSSKPEFLIKPFQLKKIPFEPGLSLLTQAADYRLPEIKLPAFNGKPLLNRLPASLALLPLNTYMPKAPEKDIITEIRNLWKTKTNTQNLQQS